MTNKRTSLKQKIEFLAKNWITFNIVYGKSYDKSINGNTDMYIITRKLNDDTSRLYTSKSLETAIKNLYNDVKEAGVNK